MMGVIGCPKTMKSLDLSFPTLKHEKHDLAVKESTRACL